MKTKSLKILVVLLISTLILGGCFNQPSASFGDIQTQAAMFAQATLTSMAFEGMVGATSTSLSATQAAVQIPTTVPPTAVINTPVPVPTVPVVIPTVIVVPGLPTASRLSFAAGATNVYKEDSVGYDDVTRYVFWANSGQLVDISLSSAKDLSLGLYQVGGSSLLSTSQAKSFFRGYLPATGDWYIDVKSTPDSANFSFNLMIPQRLTFAAGTSSMVVSGSIPNNRSHNFIVRGNAGQRMVITSSPSATLGLSIYHINGNVLQSMMSPRSNFDGTLPESGDYIINVNAPAGSGTLSFMMEIAIN